MQELLALETSLLSPQTRHSRPALEALLAPDFREFTSSGQICSREEVIAALLSETPSDWTIDHFQVHELSDSLTLVTYTATRRDAHNTRRSLRSSLWQRTDTTWRMLFHQGTPIPA